VLHQAVRAVSKNRPKYPMLDIPFKKKLILTFLSLFQIVFGGLLMPGG
jgi:hypothetical protein